MLQQTQVRTVIPYFHRFITRLPTLADLATADEQVVLRLWQGLGYYSRARNLRRCARAVVERYAGRVPATVNELLTLPGVGRYTAGAIASIAYGTSAPILDGNVARVLCRLDKIETDPRDRATTALLWARAGAILPTAVGGDLTVDVSKHPEVVVGNGGGGGDAGLDIDPERNTPSAVGLRVGDFNSALMELGAIVCTPRHPTCLFCPVQHACGAFAAGLVDRIPRPRVAKARAVERRVTVCVARAGDGAYLIEQRPASGRWAGLWQFATVPRPTPKRVPRATPKRTGSASRPTARSIGTLLGMKLHNLVALGQVRHALTHRQYEFDAYHAQLAGDEQPGGDRPGAERPGAEQAADDRAGAHTDAPPGTNPPADTPADAPTRRWVTLADLAQFPMSKPQLMIAKLAARRLEDDDGPKR